MQSTVISFVLIVSVFSLIYMANQLMMKLEATKRSLDRIVKHLNLDTSQILDEELKELIKQRRKIEAVRLYREKTGKSLKEASEYVEAL